MKIEGNAISTDPETVLRNYLDALIAGDIAAIESSFAPDATWWVHGRLPMSGTKRGRAEILEFLLSAGSMYRAGTQELEFGDITAAGDRAVLEWRVRAIGTATGKPYDNSYAGVFVIRDGWIVEVREYLDSLHTAEVIYGAVTSGI